MRRRGQTGSSSDPLASEPADPANVNIELRSGAVLQFGADDASTPAAVSRSGDLSGDVHLSTEYEKDGEITRNVIVRFLDECIKSLKDGEHSSTMLSEAASRGQIPDPGSVSNYIQHETLQRLGANYSLGEVQAAYTALIKAGDEGLEGKLQKITELSAKTFFSGYLKRSFAVVEGCSDLKTRQMSLATEMLEERMSLATEISEMGFEERHALAVDMMQKQREWRDTLSSVPEEQQNEYLLAMESPERRKILRMQLVCQMLQIQDRSILSQDVDACEHGQEGQHANNPSIGTSHVVPPVHMGMDK